MGLTLKRQYDHYSLDLKKALVRLANHEYFYATDIAEALELHPVLIYRWRKELNDGKWDNPMPTTKKNEGPTKEQLYQKELELKQAQARIRKLEKQLKRREEDIDILKKAERFFAKHRE